MKTSEKRFWDYWKQTYPAFQEKIEAQTDNLFSLYWEIRLALFTAVMLVSAAFGILIYQNIDSIGHQVILIVNAVLVLVGFGICFKKKPYFSKSEDTFSEMQYDAALLLSNVLFGVFLGYLQFQYQIFGNRWYLVSLISSFYCFFCAYFFDSKSVLSLAISSFTASVGLVIQPFQLISSGIQDHELIPTALVLGVLWTVLGFFSIQRKIKKHFEGTYFHYGFLLFVVPAIFQLVSESWLFYTILVFLGSVFFVEYAIRTFSKFLFTASFIALLIVINRIFWEFFLNIDIRIMPYLMLPFSFFIIAYSIYIHMLFYKKKIKSVLDIIFRLNN